MKLALNPLRGARTAVERGLLLCLFGLLATACSMNRYYQPAGGYEEAAPSSDGYQLESVTVASSDSGWFSSDAPRAPRAPQARAAMAPAPMATGSMPQAVEQSFVADAGPRMVAGPANNPGGEKGGEKGGAASEKPRSSPLLIYTGQVVLAVFDVTATQDRALATIEAFGGYSSQRNAQQMVFRVPAEKFREALDALKKLGDVLRLDWAAQDVGEEYRDLQIRLKNNIDMRERLLVMLAGAKEIEDALAVEAQLERITLEIERINGQLRSLQDRLAYSTIAIQFSPIAVTQVPKSDYRLPFPWLNQLGLEFLMQL
jgi:hypothetical protein